MQYILRMTLHCVIEPLSVPFIQMKSLLHRIESVTVYVWYYSFVLLLAYLLENIGAA